MTIGVFNTTRVLRGEETHQGPRVSWSNVKDHIAYLILQQLELGSGSSVSSLTDRNVTREVSAIQNERKAKNSIPEAEKRVMAFFLSKVPGLPFEQTDRNGRHFVQADSEPLLTQIFGRGVVKRSIHDTSTEENIVIIQGYRSMCESGNQEGARILKSLYPNMLR